MWWTRLIWELSAFTQVPFYTNLSLLQELNLLHLEPFEQGPNKQEDIYGGQLAQLEIIAFNNLEGNG